MLMAAAELLDERPDATRDEVREWISGNYCRCTGYHAIVDAICTVLDARREGRAVPPAMPAPPTDDEALHDGGREPSGQADLGAVGG
jgi:xanthine dehydrogenase iron-sulfur cluster and FAD-binding subunit A